MRFTANWQRVRKRLHPHGRRPISKRFFRDIVKSGKDVLQLSFSSQLSAHYSYCEMARKAVMEEYPEARIELVDTLRISIGAALLVEQAQRMKMDGAGLDEIRDWVLTNIDRAHAWFSVDDLGFLKRGGRVSGTAAMVGTILGVKPILKLNGEGKIVATDKVKGTRNVERYFIDVVHSNIEDAKNQTVLVAHAGDLENAKRIKTMIEQALGLRGRGNPRHRPGDRVPHRPRRAGRGVYGQGDEIDTRGAGSGSFFSEAGMDSIDKLQQMIDRAGRIVFFGGAGRFHRERAARF